MTDQLLNPYYYEHIDKTLKTFTIRKNSIKYYVILYENLIKFKGNLYYLHLKIPKK